MIREKIVYFGISSQFSPFSSVLLRFPRFFSRMLRKGAGVGAVGIVEKPREETHGKSEPRNPAPRPQQQIHRNAPEQEQNAKGNCPANPNGSGVPEPRRKHATGHSSAVERFHGQQVQKAEQKRGKRGKL